MHLNFTAPVPLDRPFEVGLELDPSDWAEDPTYTTAVVGATTMRDANYEWARGLDRLVAIPRTVDELGGEERVSRVVAASPVTILVEDIDGRMWAVPEGGTVNAFDSVGSGPISESEVTSMRASYAEIKRANNDSNFADVMEANWQVELDAIVGEPVELTNEGITAQLSSLTRDDGNIDIGALKAQVDFDAASAQLGNWETLDRELGEYRQAHFPHQRADNIGLPDDVTFQVPRCSVQIGPPPEAREDRLLGCGAAAFTSLVWREWAGYSDSNGRLEVPSVQFYDMPYDGDYFGGSYREGGLAARMATPVEYSEYGRGEIQEDMKSCWFISGTATMRGNWVKGGNRWLQRQHETYGTPRMRIQSNTSILLGNIGSAGKKASMLREQMKKRRKPAVAFVNFGLLSSSHVAPVANYRTRRRCAWFVCWRQLEVQTTDWGDRWFNLSAGWVRDAGVAYIERH